MSFNLGGVVHFLGGGGVCLSFPVDGPVSLNAEASISYTVLMKLSVLCASFPVVGPVSSSPVTGVSVAVVTGVLCHIRTLFF